MHNIKLATFNMNLRIILCPSYGPPPYVIICTIAILFLIVKYSPYFSHSYGLMI